jgi:uncharacterized protein YkwD
MGGPAASTSGRYVSAWRGSGRMLPPTKMARHRPPCFVAVLVVCLLGPAATAVAACPGGGSLPTHTTVDRAVDATLCLVNRARAEHGLAALRSAGALERAAAAHSRDMVRRDFFSHESPGGSTPQQRIDRTGYLNGARSWAIGETIAWGTGGYATPSSIVRGWLNSPGHRAILLDGRYRDVGIGVAIGAPSGSGGATFTGDFGARR